MISISKFERWELERVGLIRYKTSTQEPNLIVTNKQHRSADKGYFVVEEPAILLFLQHYESFNLQKITPAQVEILKTKELIKDSQIQRPHEYKPRALVYLDNHNQYRMKKVPFLMIALGYWQPRYQNQKGED